ALCLLSGRWAREQGGGLAAAQRLALASQLTGPWSALCAAAGHEPDVWRGDTHRGRYAWRKAILPDVSRHGHQWATTHTGMEAASLDRVLFSDFEALAGDGSLSSAERGCLLRPSGHTPDGVFGIVVHLTGGVQRAADDGGDHLAC